MELARQHPSSLSAVMHWKEHIRGEPSPANFVELRQHFPHADQVTVKSGNIATIFNLANGHRLITAIHYNRRIVHILRLLTHAAYDKEFWKDEL
jgi:mRNA-degrading endonuclease HigB of HigAB toxin-antitoxin module